MDNKNNEALIERAYTYIEMFHVGRINSFGRNARSDTVSVFLSYILHGCARARTLHRVRINVVSLHARHGRVRVEI